MKNMRGLNQKRELSYSLEKITANILLIIIKYIVEIIAKDSYII